MRHRLQKAARKAARQVRKRLPHKLRSKVDEFALESPRGKALRAQLLGERPLSARLGVEAPQALVQLSSESTYAPGEEYSIYAMENVALRTRLFEALDKVDNLQAQLAEFVDIPCDEAEPLIVKDGAPHLSVEGLTTLFVEGQPSNPGHKRHLVIANDYPDIGKEYGNGFIHRRVKYYLAEGVDVDVIVVNPYLERRVYEFDGVRVLVSPGPELPELLNRVPYVSVSAHFLNATMWRHLEDHLASIDLHVFLHGYECDRWIRRIFALQGGTGLERGIDRTLALQRFWRKVTEHPHQPASYTFVSQWWREAVTEDMELVFPGSRSHIIHNFIDTDMFNYVPKDPAQRFRLLWVRSAANYKYGHDIAIAILKRLAKTKYWKDIEVTIVGDGQHFGDFETALGHHKNVTIRRKFVSQEEVAALHKTHGIVLVPSRLDSQGVSRDEAMSSGLVPVTNLVTAIPEFVDASCAIVAGEESANELAAGIEKVLADPQLFLTMSRAASERAASQCGAKVTVAQELELLGLTESKEPRA